MPNDPTPQPDEREAFCHDLGLHLADTLDALGVEDADLSDGRMLADTVYCLGFRRIPQPGTDTDLRELVARIVER